jgi:hypothetical protein
MHAGPYLEKNYWGGGGANMDHVAEGHCEGEGAGGASCAERKAETTKLNGKLKRGPLQHYKNTFKMATELLCLTCLQLDFL